MTRASKFFALSGRLLPTIILSAFLVACSSEPPPLETAGTTKRASAEMVGIASWYGGKFHGRTTASGEPFNMNAMTAAHRSLPFGTRVRVTNLENGRSVVLRINDRGPYAKRRIIDVSRHAAEHLGFLHDGLAKVRVEVI